MNLNFENIDSYDWVCGPGFLTLTHMYVQWHAQSTGGAEAK